MKAESVNEERKRAWRQGGGSMEHGFCKGQAVQQGSNGSNSDPVTWSETRQAVSAARLTNIALLWNGILSHGLHRHAGLLVSHPALHQPQLALLPERQVAPALRHGIRCLL